MWRFNTGDTGLWARAGAVSVFTATTAVIVRLPAGDVSLHLQGEVAAIARMLPGVPGLEPDDLAEVLTTLADVPLVRDELARRESRLAAQREERWAP